MSAPSSAPGDVAGFIDSLSALSAHIVQRETFEADVRRGWSKMAGACGVLTGLEAIVAVSVSPPAFAGNTPVIGIFVAAVSTSAVAALLFSAAAASPWRAAADSVDRLALRHEDSPLRDHIRITQWMLFDSALARFSANERRVNAVIAQGVLLVSIMGTLSLALYPVLRNAFSDPTNAEARGGSAALAVFLILTIITIIATMRAGKQSFRTAQHYARQVLAFDADFGGFLPRAEKEHVTSIANTALGGGGDEAA